MTLSGQWLLLTPPPPFLHQLGSATVAPLYLLTSPSSFLLSSVWMCCVLDLEGAPWYVHISASFSSAHFLLKRHLCKQAFPNHFPLPPVTITRLSLWSPLINSFWNILSLCIYLFTAVVYSLSVYHHLIEWRFIVARASIRLAHNSFQRAQCLNILYFHEFFVRCHCV